MADDNLRRVYPEMEDGDRHILLRKIYRNLALTVAENYVQKESRLIESSTISGKDNVTKAFSYNKGAILATAHFGNWETARLFPLFSVPLSVLVKKQHNPYFDTFNNSLRTKHGVSVINYRKGLRDILAKLNKNEMVAILADQNAGNSGLMLDFMGSPASHWKGVAKISLRYKVPIVPGFALRRDKGGTKFCMEPIIYHPELEDNEENCIYILEKIDRVLESYIEKYPEQWLWLHKRWKKQSSNSDELL